MKDVQIAAELATDAPLSHARLVTAQECYPPIPAHQFAAVVPLPRDRKIVLALGAHFALLEIVIGQIALNGVHQPHGVTR